MLRAHRYLQQTVTEDQAQTLRNRNIVQSVQEVIDWLERTPAHPALYRELTDEHSSVEAQELINTLLIEMYPELVDSLDDELGCHETMDLQPDMKARKLKELIEQSFDWALTYSEESAEDNYWFWYRSAEKKEPRLGIRAEESGAEKETALANLKHTLQSAGTRVANLTQVLIYVTDRDDLAAVNREYATFVAEPFPNRAAIIVSGFARAEMLVEIVAYAVVPE